MTTRGSKLLDELNSASQSVSGTTERGKGWKKERGSERGTVQNFRQSRFEHNFSYGKVSSSVCPPTLERGKERQVAGFSRFPSAFSNFCRPRGESWKRWDKQNRYRTEGTHRGSKRRHRIEPFLCSPPPAPTNFRIVFVENFRRAKHTSKISLPRRKRDIYTPMKTEKERKKEKYHSPITSTRHRTATRGKGQRANSWSEAVQKKRGGERGENQGMDGGKGGDKRDSGKRAERRSTILVVNLSVVIQEGGTVGDKFHREHRPPLLRNQFETCTPAAARLSPPRWLDWLYPPFDWRDKSLRLTGSRRITGTGDIYASSPTDRGITRNKEIANLLRAHPSFSFPVRDSRPTPSPSSLL